MDGNQLESARVEGFIPVEHGNRRLSASELGLEDYVGPARSASPSQGEHGSHRSSGILTVLAAPVRAHVTLHDPVSSTLGIRDIQFMRHGIRGSNSISSCRRMHDFSFTLAASHFCMAGMVYFGLPAILCSQPRNEVHQLFHSHVAEQLP